MIRTDKLIICVAPCGNFLMKDANPNMPIQPVEIAEDVYRSWNEGASIAHIHARDKEGKATNEPEVLREIDRLIREKGCDIVLQHTTAPSRKPGATIEDAFKSLEATPEMASLDIGVAVSIREDRMQMWTRSFVERLARAMQQKGVKPESEIYTTGGMLEVEYLIEKGLLAKPYWISFVMDMQRASQNVTPYTPKNLMHYVDMLPQDSMFSAIGIAATEAPAVTMSILLGGHARVGFEDNFYYSKGVLAKSNADLVAKIARIGRDLGRDPATSSEARQLLGIPQLE